MNPIRIYFRLFSIIYKYSVSIKIKSPAFQAVHVMSFFTILLVIAGVGGLYFYPLEKEFVGSAWAAIFISVYAVNYFIFLFGKRYRIIVSKHGDDIKTWEKRLVLAYIIFSFAMLVLFVAIARKSYNP